MPKKAAPDVIELSGETYRSMVENSNDLIWVLDAQGNFVYLNRRAEEVSGYLLDELRGTGFAPLIPKADLPRVRKLFSDALSGKSVRSEISFYAKNGNLVTLSANAAPLVEKRKAAGIACFGQDITERERAEEALRRSEASLAESQRLAHIGNWDWDLKSDKAWWSDEMCRIFGVPAGGLRGLDESLKFIHPDDRAAVRKAVADSLENKRPYSIDYRIVRPDGAVREIHAQGEVIFGGDGKPVRMLGTVQDITERREMEERYRTAIENSNDLIWMLDAKGDVTYANRKALEVGGFTLEDVKTKHFSFRIPKEDVPRVQKLVTEAMSGKPVTYEASFYARDGRLIAVSINAVPMYEAGRITGVASFARDMTRRKKAEETLRTSEARLAEAQRVAHLGNWDWDLRTGELYWSDENYRIFRIPRDVKPSFEGFMRYVHPDDREAVDRAVQDALAGKKPYDIDMRVIRGDGTRGVVNSRAEVFFDKAGKPERMVGTVQDITERRKAEDALGESEYMFRALFENAPDGKLIADAETRRLVLGNRKICEMLGYGMEEIKKLAITDLHPRESLPYALEQLGRQERGEITLARELPVKRKDGTVFYADINAMSLVVGGRKCLMGNFRDVTERKKAEEEIKKLNESLEQRVMERTSQLEQANMRLADDISERMKIEEELKAEARILDAASDSIFLHDAEGEFYYVNETACRDRGYTKEELLATNLHQLDVPEYAKLIEPRIKELMEKGETEFESAHFRKDGSILPIEVHLRLFDYKGRKLILSVARDVSMRKKTQDELRRSEAMLAEAQAVAHVGSWEYDLKTGEHRWSDEAYRILGRVPRGVKADFSTLMAAIHPDDREPMKKAIDETISGRSPLSTYVRVVRPDGAIRTVYVRTEVMHDDSGKPMRHLGTVLDVTELKKAEAKSEESEEKYRTIFENTRAATAIIEENTILSMVNPEFERVSGYSRAEIEGKMSWTEFIPPEDLEKMKEFHRLRRVDPGAVPSNYAFRFIDRQRNTRQAFMTIDLLPGTKRSIASILDITERKKAEDKLKESEARLREAQGTAHLGSWEWDTRTNGMQWSDETYKILGLPAGSRATPDRFFDSIPLAERDVFRRLLDDAVRTKEPISVDYHVVRSDGSVRTVHWNVVALFDAEGNPAGMSGTMLDVTDLKQAEAKLKKYAEELEEKLGLLESRGVQRIEFLMRKGNSYLIREEHYENSTIVLYNLVKSGLAGICVTTIDPGVLTAIHGLKAADCSFVWLSATAKGENVVSPTDLEAASTRVGDLLARHKDSFVHLAGLEGIIAANGFDKCYDFLNSLVYSASKNGSRLIVAVNTGAVDAKQLERIGELLTKITDEDLGILGLKAAPRQ